MKQQEWVAIVDENDMIFAICFATSKDLVDSYKKIVQENKQYKLITLTKKY